MSSSGDEGPDEGPHDDDLTFRVLAPSLVPGQQGARSARRSSGRRGREFTGGGESEAEIGRLRMELHLDGGGGSPVLGDIEAAFGRYASRPSVSRQGSSAAQRCSGASAGHAALGTPPAYAEETRRLAAAAIDEAHRQADEVVAQVRREAAEQLAQMQAELDQRVREMAGAMREQARTEAVEQLRAELKASKRADGRDRDRDAPPLLLSRAFRGWRSSSHRQAEYNARLRRLLCHFSHFGLTTALRGWKAGIAWLRRARGLLAKAGRRMRAIVVSRTLATWYDHVRRMRMGRRALGRLLHARISHAFEHWRRILEVAAESDARLADGEVVVLRANAIDEQRERLVLHAMLRWQRSTLLGIFHRWAGKAAAGRKTKHHLLSCIRRLSQQVAAKAYLSWVDHAVVMRRQRAVLSRCIARFQHRAQASALRQWLSHVRRQRLARRVLGAFCHRRVAKAWHKWVAHTLRGEANASGEKLSAQVTKAVLYFLRSTFAYKSNNRCRLPFS